MLKKLGLLCVLSGLMFPLIAQEKANVKTDSLGAARDTTTIDSTGVEKIVSYSSRYNPRKAILFAAVLPGAGQIYNKKYWKLPLVYGGLGLLVHAVYFYEIGYVKYKNELFITINGGTAPSGIPLATLRTVVDTYRRQRDYFIAIGALVYILQMVDAHVDAHLKEFDLNPKLRAQIKPYAEQNMMIGRSSGVALVIKF